jgi:hypothetical protein
MRVAGLLSIEIAAEEIMETRPEGRCSQDEKLNSQLPTSLCEWLIAIGLPIAGGLSIVLFKMLATQ